MARRTYVKNRRPERPPHTGFKEVARQNKRIPQNRLRDTKKLSGFHDDTPKKKMTQRAAATDYEKTD